MSISRITKIAEHADCEPDLKYFRFLRDKDIALSRRLLVVAFPCITPYHTIPPTTAITRFAEAWERLYCTVQGMYAYIRSSSWSVMAY